MAFLDEEEQSHREAAAGRRFAARPITSVRSWCAGRWRRDRGGASDPDRAGDQGCLNARKERNFENYVSDLKAITTQSNQLSDDFFNRLNDPGNLSPLSFEAEIKADRGTAESLASRVEALSTPDELKSAQNQLNFAFQQRSDAFTGISDNISTALGSQGRTQAVNAIAGYMQYFLASDILYKQAQPQIDSALKDQGIDEKAPDSVFLPSTDWLDPLKVSSALAMVSGGKQATSGTHGLALYQTTVKPGEVSLDPNTAATISGSGPPEVDVQVQNRGIQRRPTSASASSSPAAPKRSPATGRSRESPPAASRPPRSRSSRPRTRASS